MASELEDLRSFMEQRFAEAYPDLDTSAGSVADVEIITPLVNRLAPDPYDSPIDAFLKARLASEFPNLVIQDGEPIDDFAIKPNRVFLEPLRRQVQAITRNQSLQDPTVLNDREADALAANYFSSRNLGGYAIGVVRLYFSAPRFVTVTPTNAASTSSGLRFLPVENQSISPDDMLFNVSGSLYYFDVVVRAEEQGSDYNIERGQISGIEGLPEVVRIENRVRFDEGAPRESTTEFLSRVEQELTEKSLVTFRGIRARLLNLFESVRSISVIGHNDVEMERDILTGNPGDTYAFGNMTSATGLSSIFIPKTNGVTNGVVGQDDFVKIGVEVGDVFRIVDLVAGTIRDHTVTEVVSGFQVRVDPAPPTLAIATPVLILGPGRGTLTISGIPGGILQPNTPEGTLIIPNNEVHIGGTLDVFVRAGEPQERTIEVSGVRDASPLHFGLDLEPFGADPAEFVQITEKVEDAATTTASFVGPGDAQATLYIKVADAGTVPWRPTDDDLGRYLQLLGTDGAGTDYGLYLIQGVGQEQVLNGERAIPVTVSIFDQLEQTDLIGISDRSSVYDLDFRLVEEISVASRVRDRDFPQTDFNGNNNGIGAGVGDSVVIENGTDAGIYSIRRILTSIGEDDTLILDRDLTSSTPKPNGAGTGSGLRYRVADELELDLISPRITKMPLGDIFYANDLSSVANLGTVNASGTSNFVLAGVEDGDILEILEGNNVGLYTIESVAGTSLGITPAPPTTANNQVFTIYRSFTGIQLPLVRVESVELLDSSDQPTGITVPYGKEVDVRALGTFSNRAAGLNVESFTGEVLALPDLFEDANVDFDAQKVRAGDRLEILEGQNLGEYEILEVGPAVGLTNNQLRVVPVSVEPGARDFVDPEDELHYRIGEPSTGLVRIYFLQPTSMEVVTGLSGGRLRFQEGGQDLQFRFSQVFGRTVLPAPGSGDDNPRDLRVVRSYSIGGGDFETILEVTDTNNPDTFELELEEGDLFIVQEQILFRNNIGSAFADLEIFGTAAGLRTVTGSNRVTVPENSHIDFEEMGDLAGQVLAIESGPDQGVYTINRVIDGKTLELNTPMTSSTVGLVGRETAVLYDGEIIDPGDGFAWLRDTTDSGQLGDIGDYVTIFEAKATEPEGTYEITDKDAGAQRVKLDGFSGALPVTLDTFSWIVTGSDTPGGSVGYPFHVYQRIGKEVQVTQVATTAPAKTGLGTGGVQGGLVTFKAGLGAFAPPVEKGDRLEILAGPNAGVYVIESTNGNDEVTVYSANPFAVVSVTDQYRVWAGVHGPRRMVTVGPFEGSDGLVDPGPNLIYSIARPRLQRVSSTEMEESVDDSGLYYVDMAVESMGPGNDRNLPEGSRLVVERGLEADGYVYEVENSVLTFSMFEQVGLSFDRRFLPVGNSDLPENRTEITGRNLQIRYSTSSTVQIIDDLLRSDAERPVNANPMARHFLPSFVRTQIVYSGGSSTQVTSPDVEDYINNLGPLEELEVSDLEALFTRRGATSIRHPIVLVSVTHDINRDLIVERSEDVIGGTVVPYAGTARISSFFATVGDGVTIIRN